MAVALVTLIAGGITVAVNITQSVGDIKSDVKVLQQQMGDVRSDVKEITAAVRRAQTRP